MGRMQLTTVLLSIACVGSLLGASRTSQVPTLEDDGRLCYHPAEVTMPYLIEQQDDRRADGSYEFRYVLSNGDTRYERSYWAQHVLVRMGFYSHPIPRNQFLTVFYTSDANGYHVKSSAITETQPDLPRRLTIPPTTT